MTRPWLVIAIASSCAPGNTVIPPPELDGARAALIVFAKASQVLAMYAIDLDVDAIEARLELGSNDADATIDVVALGFASTLAELELAPGPVTLPVEGRRLPPVRVSRRASVSSGAASAWTELTTLSPWIAGLRLPPRADPCVAHRLRVIELGGRATSVVAIDDRRALVLLDGDHHVVIGEDGFTPQPVATYPGGPRNKAHRDRNGNVWVFGNGGQAASFDPVAMRLDPIDPMPDRDELAFADDGEDDPAGRFWVLSTRARFDAFENGRWVMFPDEPRQELRDSARAIGEVGGSVVVTGYMTPSIDVFDASGARTQVASPSNIGFGAGVTVPGLGLVLGGSEGSLFLFRPPATLEPLPIGEGARALSLPIYTMARGRDSVYVGTGFGFVAQFVIGHGLCPARQVVSDVDSLAVIGEDVVVVGSDGSAIWLEAP